MLPASASCGPNNPVSVTPSTAAIFSNDAMEGEAWPFSTCEMKLGEKPDRAATVRTDIREVVRK
jgi:hypothetical protein